MMKSVLKSLIILILIGRVSSVHAIEIVTIHYPPLTNKNTNEGILNRLVIKAANEVGIKVNFSYQPMNRLVKVWKDNDKLLLLSKTLFTDKRIKDFHYTSVFSSNFSLLYKVTQKIPARPPYRGLNVGLNASNRLEINLSERLGVDVSSYPTIDSGIKMLLADRVDAIFCPSITCKYFEDQNQEARLTSQIIETVSIDLLLNKGSNEQSLDQYKRISEKMGNRVLRIENLLPASGTN